MNGNKGSGGDVDKLSERVGVLNVADNADKGAQQQRGKRHGGKKPEQAHYVPKKAAAAAPDSAATEAGAEKGPGRKQENKAKSAAGEAAFPKEHVKDSAGQQGQQPVTMCVGQLRR